MSILASEYSGSQKIMEGSEDDDPAMNCSGSATSCSEHRRNPTLVEGMTSD